MPTKTVTWAVRLVPGDVARSSERSSGDSKSGAGMCSGPAPQCRGGIWRWFDCGYAGRENQLEFSNKRSETPHLSSGAGTYMQTLVKSFIWDNQPQEFWRWKLVPHCSLGRVTAHFPKQALAKSDHNHSHGQEAIKHLTRNWFLLGLFCIIQATSIDSILPFH